MTHASRVGRLRGDDRAKARASAEAIRRAVADGAWGPRSVVHLDLCRPRRGVMLTMWDNLPGLMFEPGRRAYTHSLLPGWEYNEAEMQTEMLDDLERFAESGAPPKVATR